MARDSEILGHSDILKVLLRVCIELSYRAYCMREYLKQIQSDESLVEYSPLASTVASAIESLDQELYENIATVNVLVNKYGGNVSKALEVFYGYLRTYSKHINSVHEMLVYLPRYEVSNETRIMLSLSYQESFDTYSPSIILGSLINAFEFDFFERMRDQLPDLKEIALNEEANIVLQLAICDRRAATAWPVLAHELGHTVDINNEISKKVTDEFVRKSPTRAHDFVSSWAKELTADLIAAEVIGPSAILATIDMAYCVLPIPDSQLVQTHPNLLSRLRIVSEYLREKYKFDILQRSRQSFELAIRYQLQQDNAPEYKRRLDKIEKDEAFIIKPIAESILGYIDNLGLPSHNMVKDSIDRCIQRLAKKTPISAQGQSRSTLQEKLGEFQKKSYDENSMRVDAFRELTAEFAEHPLSIPTIMASAHKRRDDIVNTAINRDEVKDIPLLKSPGDCIATICRDIQSVDDLVAYSIDGSYIQQTLTNSRV